MNGSCSEAELVQIIVEDILKSNLDQMPLHVAKYPVGINSRVEEIQLHLDRESNDVCVVGIYGLGGVGKTTIAKALYNKIFNHFKVRIFLEHVREMSETNEGIIRLQEKLLFEILGVKDLKACNISKGTNMMNKSLFQKKVFIVLDDVDKLNLIEKLLGNYDLFAPGSRIIITTRDKHLLATSGKGYSTYEVKELDDDEALVLFSMHAFQKSTPKEDYSKLANHFIYYAQGLPLALEIIGTALFGRTKPYWESALEKYEKILDKNIQNVLQISYEGLEQVEQIIFLDITFFFKGLDREYVEAMLDSCNLHPDIGIRRLIEKCLVTIDQFDKLWMHDLVQQMGREIVRRESPQLLGTRSRLCCYEDAFEVLTKNKV